MQLFIINWWNLVIISEGYKRKVAWKLFDFCNEAPILGQQKEWKHDINNGTMGEKDIGNLEAYQ